MLGRTHACIGTLSGALAAVLLPAVLLAGPAPAARQGSGPYVQHEPRAMARVVYFNASGAANANPIAGEYAIEYGKPAWRAEYDANFDELTRGKRLRLGKDWWTTLHTFTTLEFGGKEELKPGSWYLALERSQKGEWSLIALEPAPILKSKLDAFGSAQTRGGVKLPLQYEATQEASAELSIRFLEEKEQLRQQTLEIRFGKHRLTATVKPAI